MPDRDAPSANNPSLDPSLPPPNRQFPLLAKIAFFLAIILFLRYFVGSPPTPPGPAADDPTFAKELAEFTALFDANKDDVLTREEARAAFDVYFKERKTYFWSRRFRDAQYEKIKMDETFDRFWEVCDENKDGVLEGKEIASLYVGMKRAWATGARNPHS